MPNTEVGALHWLLIMALLEGFAVTHWGVCYLILRRKALLLSSHICFEIMLGFIEIQSYFRMKKLVWLFSSLCVLVKISCLYIISTCECFCNVCTVYYYDVLSILCGVRSVCRATMTSLNDIIVYCWMAGSRVVWAMYDFVLSLSFVNICQFASHARPLI